jgi:hypothetical protein
VLTGGVLAAIGALAAPTGCGESYTAVPGGDATTFPPETLECAALALASYERKEECRTSEGEDASCAANPKGSTLSLGADGVISAVAQNNPLLDAGDHKAGFGVANLIFTLPGAPRTLDLNYELSIDELSPAKMKIRAGCFVEWSGAGAFNTLIPLLSRENLFALSYTRNGAGAGADAIVTGATIPNRPLTLSTNLSIAAGIGGSSVSGSIREGMTPYLTKSWSGQPSAPVGTLPPFEPTQYRLFCGGTVEDGDANLMQVKLRISKVSGKNLLPKRGSSCPDGRRHARRCAPAGRYRRRSVTRGSRRFS